MRFALLFIACSVVGCAHTSVAPTSVAHTSQIHTPEAELTTSTETQTSVDAARVAQRFFQPVFPAMDCEMVGRASKDEIDDHFPAMFFYLDRNHDRVITQKELLDSQANATSAERLFLYAEMDADQDGRVTTEEYRAYASRAFDLLDVNGDGDLTEAEVDMPAFRRKVAKQ